MPGNDERAASEVIGAVIIFAFLVITFAIYQGVVIPQQNRSVEFEHNQAVQVSMQDLRNAIRQTATAGAEASVSIALGADYPRRVLGLNPGITAGSLQTESMGAVTVDNVTATDSEVAQYFGNSTTSLGPFETKSLTYRPVYTHYSQAPIIRYENTLAYNQFPSGVNLTITNQAVVDGRKITLVTLAGNVSATRRGTVTVDTQTVSTATNTVPITNENGPINITIATRLTAADWTDLLADELDPTGTESDKFVSAVEQTGPHQVSIVLEPGVVYEFRLAKVGVGSGVSDTDARYIVDETGNGTSVTENGTQQLVVEVRDRFNNPVSNVSVQAQVTSSAGTDDAVSPSSRVTDADGRAVITYLAPNDVHCAQEADIEASFDGDGTANETVTFHVRVLDADGSGVCGGGEDEVNPAGDTAVVLNQTSQEDQNGTAFLRLSLLNRGAEDRTLDQARISFYYAPNVTEKPDEGWINDSEDDALIIRDRFEPINQTITVPAGGTQTLDLFFYTGGSRVSYLGSHWIVFTVIYDNGRTSTYYVQADVLADGGINPF